jgi:hypothetical protein
MKGKNMPWNYDPDRLVAILEDAGFDAVIYDNVEAVKEEGDSNHQVYINPQGKLRYQFARLLEKDQYSKYVLGKDFNVEREKREIYNSFCQLDNADELILILQNLPQIIGKDEK